MNGKPTGLLKVILLGGLKVLTNLAGWPLKGNPDQQNGINLRK